MGYICLVIDLEAGVAERFSDAMLESGALSVSVEDPLAGTPAEVPLYDEPDWKEDDAAGGWTLYRLRVLFPQDTPDLPGIVAAAATTATRSTAADNDVPAEVCAESYQAGRGHPGTRAERETCPGHPVWARSSKARALEESLSTSAMAGAIRPAPPWPGKSGPDTSTL